MCMHDDENGNLRFNRGKPGLMHLIHRVLHHFGCLENIRKNCNDLSAKRCLLSVFIE